MSILLINRPNWIVPVFQELIESDPTVYKIQFKRFPADYMWRDFLDLTPIMLGMEALDLTATEALVTANQAVTDAAAAQNTADEALALGGAGGGARRATMWMDEAHYVTGTPTRQINSAYIGNVIVFTTTLFAEFTFSFVSGALNDGELVFVGTRSNASGEIDIFVDDEFMVTIDLYNSTTLINQEMSAAFGLGNPTFAAGYHKLRVRVQDKHASSLGYACALSKIYLRGASD